MPADVPVSKSAVRQFFRVANREAEWTELQGIAYGAEMERAEPFAGALDFIRKAVTKGHSVKIISHRTKHPIKGDRTNLHQSALRWLQREGFVGSNALSPDDVFFETTKEAKLARIRSEGCEVFVDDLPEILGSPLFPSGAQGWLFAPSATPASGGCVVTDWDSFARQIL